MDPKYCLPIITSEKSAVLAAINTNLAEYDYFEVWLDYIEDFDMAFVEQLAGLLGDKLIVLFRRQNLEKIKMDIRVRQSILSSLTDTHVFVDLDITTQLPELAHIQNTDLNLNLILSYHDYAKTPTEVQLRSIIGTMEVYQPAIYKLSTMCGEPADALQLMHYLLEQKTKDRRVIILGMGGHGAITRVFGSSWGNELTYAPLTPSEQSAPGQLTKEQLENIFKELGQ